MLTGTASMAPSWLRNSLTPVQSYEKPYEAPARYPFPKIKVLLVDDHTILRQGLQHLLEADGQFQVVGEAANGRDAIQQVQKLLPDIVIMDIAMPIMNGLEATRQIKKRFPSTRVVILTTRTYEDSIAQALQAGASGYLLKEADSTELVHAIQEVNEGTPYVSPAFSRRILEDYVRGPKPRNESPKSTLSNREKELLQLVAEGYTNQQIAEQLCISVKTVEAHKAHIMNKLKIRGRTELIKYAIFNGLVTEEA